ncbi:MAG TPA: hypothetical protein VHN36_17725 [Ilumatobacteraceae bacterium]|nr:hypothetical protein [Ilumatobacteraceae bacterium]
MKAQYRGSERPGPFLLKIDRRVPMMWTWMLCSLSRRGPHLILRRLV